MSDAIDIRELLTAWAAWSAESKSLFGHNLLASFLPSRRSCLAIRIDEEQILRVDRAISQLRQQDEAFLPYIVMRYRQRRSIRNIARALKIGDRRARDNLIWAESLVAESFLAQAEEDGFDILPKPDPADIDKQTKDKLISYLEEHLSTR